MNHKKPLPHPGGPAPTLSRSRHWTFALLAAVGIPLLLLLLLEGILRLAGFGYPTSFFLPQTIQGREVLTENPRFGFRFFPPGLARSPTPTVFSPEKPAGTFRIFLFGESAALGDPRPAYGFGRYLEALLNERFPESQFEVICAAMTAINSHALLPIARECATLDGDLWIIYMGNNEMIGPFGATGQLGAQTPSLAHIRASLAIKRTRVGQLMEAALLRLTGADQPQAWRGLDLFTGHEIPPGSESRQRVQDNFQANLGEILNVAADAGVETLLCTVSSNLKDCSPHASVHSAAFGGSDELEWQTHYQAGIAASREGDHHEAATAFAQARDLDPRFAEVHYQLGLSHLALTNPASATELAAARDFDALPFRTTSTVNDIIRASAEHFADRQVDLLDLEKWLHQERGLPGNDLFLDHVHYNFEGNYLVARKLAEQIAATLPESVRKPIATGWLAQEQCDERLGLTAWNRYLAFETMLNRLAGPPYTNQTSNPATFQTHLQEMRDLRQAAREHTTAETRALYETALQARPNDHYLHQGFAEFLELSGDPAAAIREWKTIQQLLPHHPVAFFQTGRILAKQKQFVEAEAEIAQALGIRPDFPEALLELARCLSGQGRHEAAEARCREVLAMNPGNPFAHFHLAECLAAQERRGEAMEQLRAAIASHPGYHEAHYYLAVELGLQKKIPEAAYHFAQVIRYKPDHVLAHYNYGIALAQLRRLPEAKAQFEETLKLEPSHQAARQHLDTLNQLLARMP